MSQFLRIVTEMYGKTNERVTNRSADDGHYIADADPQNTLEPPTGRGYLCLDPISTYHIFSSYDSISTWYNINDTKVAE